MAIEFNCPHCQHPYKLKDELAGKTATCKSCRQKITIPRPVTVPDDAPAMDAAAAEAAALAALADEPVKAEQDAASRMIDVECGYCNHKWTEPLTRAGKNALCPECKQRVKIPEPKKEDILDWRQTRTKGPSLAKDNQLTLDGVQDAANTTLVSGKALKEADATGEEFEPRPLKQRVLFVVVPVALLVGLVFGGVYLTRSRTEGKENRLMADAQKELTASAEGLPKDEAPIYTALMHTAAGEYALRHDEKEKFKEGMDQFARGREALRPPPYTPARNAAVAELAVAMLALGGTEEQAREQIRLRWMPDSALKTRPNERVFTVFEELNKTLDLVLTADLEYRTHLARRLTRELVKRGQPTVAADLVPRGLFNQVEQAEARAIVALELYRADKGSDLARRIAEELRGRTAELAKTVPQPGSAQTLLLVLKIDAKPPIVPVPAGSAVSDGSRYAYTGFHLLEDRTADAIKVAQMPGKLESQLRCLTLCADWAADPAPALDAAFGLVAVNAARKDANLSPASILRLSQIAAEKGRHDQAKQFVEKVPDEALKAWAYGDAVRIRLAAAPKEKGDEAWSELPEDPKKYRAGHAWGRLSLARHNTRLSGDRDAEVKAVSAWPAPFSTFGKAGVALGLQDRDK